MKVTGSKILGLGLIADIISSTAFAEPASEVATSNTKADESPISETAAPKAPAQ